MPKELTLEQTYDKCVSEGNILLQEHLDLNKIKSMILIAKQDLEGARSLLKINPTSCGPIYKLYYDALHQLTEAYFRLQLLRNRTVQMISARTEDLHP